MKKCNLSVVEEKNEFKTILFKALQSCNINVLLGAGASCPAIAALGNIENDVDKLQQLGFENKAKYSLFCFLKEVFAKNKLLLNNLETEDITQTKNNYINFIHSLNTILINRKNDITKSAANIFTTNYDLFLEFACESLGLYFHYNDGFRDKNKLFSIPILEVAEFNKTINYSGQLYGYDTILPNLNIVKLHGSVNWEIGDENITYTNPIAIVDEFEKIDISREIASLKSKNDFLENEQISNLLKKLGIVNPTKKKFEETVLNRVYYNLLRFFSNELDKENSIIIATGFSFNDEHIKDLVTKALTTNPTLQLFVIVRNKVKVELFEKIFNKYNNVTLLYKDEEFNFSEFNNFLEENLKGLSEND